MARAVGLEPTVGLPDALTGRSDTIPGTRDYT